MQQSPPAFAAGSPLLEGAFEFALGAHHGPRTVGDTEIDHPVAVADLLHQAGYPEEIVAAALLHDVIEDTTIEPGEIEDLYGPEVAFLVREMTEDERLEPYERRKAEHRSRIVRSGAVAAIYAADKLAKVRAVEESGASPEPSKLAHYSRTLDVLCKSHPDLPFLGELRCRLEALTAASAG